MILKLWYYIWLHISLQRTCFLTNRIPTWGIKFTFDNMASYQNTKSCLCSLRTYIRQDLQVKTWKEAVTWYKSVFQFLTSECFYRKTDSLTQTWLPTAAGTLTTGAVGAPPAWLTLTGVGCHTSAMDTVLCTVGWTWREEIRPHVQERKNTLGTMRVVLVKLFFEMSTMIKSHVLIYSDIKNIITWFIVWILNSFTVSFFCKFWKSNYFCLLHVILTIHISQQSARVWLLCCGF